MISTYNIKVIKKTIFKNLLKKGCKKYSNVVNEINKYNGKTIKYECEFPISWSINDLDKNDTIRVGTLTGIIYFILENAKKETPKLTFTIIEFQKFFAHLDKNDLKTDDVDLNEYNKLIKELTQEEHPFGSDIYLNENWELKGEECKDIESYIKGIKKDSTVKKSVEDENTLKKDIEKVDNKIIETKTNIALNEINDKTTEFIEDDKPSNRKNILQQLKKFLSPLLFFFLLLFFMAKNPYLKNKIITFLDIDIPKNIFEIETDNVNFLTISEIKKGVIGATAYNTHLTEIGDTIVISAKINNLTKESIPVTITYPMNIAFKGNELLIFGGFYGGQNSFLDEVILKPKKNVEIDIVPLNSLNKINYFENDEFKYDYILDISESKSLNDEGLSIVSFPNKENYIIVNSFYKVKKRKLNNIGFNPNPYEDADVYGFVSIHNFEGEALDGKKDILEIPELKKGESYSFDVFVDFHNFGNYDLKNSRAWLTFQKKGKSYSQNIYATLTASNTHSITDKTLLKNLPLKWRIDFIEGRISNTHNAKTKSGKCTDEYYTNRYFSEKELIKGIPLGTLDTIYNGWCDQGHLIIKYSVTNTNYE